MTETLATMGNPILSLINGSSSLGKEIKTYLTFGGRGDLNRDGDKISSHHLLKST